MQMLMGVKSELADQQQEHQREKEGIYENIRSLSRELALCELVLNSYVPKEYQSMINQYTHWNEDIGEWQLKCVAYTGNNMRKHVEHKNSGKEPEYVDLSHVYLSYNTDGVSNSMGTKSARPRTSGVPRPTTARRYWSHQSLVQMQDQLPRVHYLFGFRAQFWFLLFLLLLFYALKFIAQRLSALNCII